MSAGHGGNAADRKLLPEGRGSIRLLIVSDVHFYTPHYYQHVVNGGRIQEPPSRLSTDLALGDEKQNSFHALIALARKGILKVDALVSCGDLTTCADPTAMNLGWLQLHRLANELKVGEPIVTAGNHDVDSRFKASSTSPARMLRYLDPSFPTSNKSAATSYWSNGYCVIEMPPLLRVVLVNTCSLHGYATEHDRHLDHGHIPEQLFTDLPNDLKKWAAPINVLVCHHHPKVIELPPEDRSVIGNGVQLLDLLNRLTPPNWLVLHGHRHLANLGYASADPSSPVIFSAGSLAANLHLNLQGRTRNQFYILELTRDGTGIRGTYDAWTWDQQEGEWRQGESTQALPATGGFGYRPDVASAARAIAQIVPPRSAGPITWQTVEDQLSDFRFLLPSERRAILDCLRQDHGVEWESDTRRAEVNPKLLRLGRSS